MSNIYIQEPPTSGKVVLKTSVGDIDIELFTKEAPLACRNFIQLCLENYYNNTVFHRLVRDFIVQGGDPNGDGSGGESIFGKPFKDEFHSRLRFVRRGLVAMANSGKNDNGSQFFFTLAATPELQNKHTIFGKVTGETVFNMTKLADGEVDEYEKPIYCHKIIKTNVLINPFTDIIPRQNYKQEEPKHKKEKHSKKEKGVKNFGLLSFGEEANEDEEESLMNKKFTGMKSTHDVLTDPKLSKESYAAEKLQNQEDEEFLEEKAKDEEEILKTTEMIRNKLKSRKTPAEVCQEQNEKSDSDSDNSDYDLHADAKKMKLEKVKKIREEIVKLKTDYKNEQKVKEKSEAVEKSKKETAKETMKDYFSEHEKYLSKNQNLPKKGASREMHTLELLSKFKSKLQSAKEKPTVNDEESEDDNSWLSHNLRFEDNSAVLARDASTKSDEWYDVYHPRNPLNKRKRENVGKKDSKK
uniref:Spliceosome-associated protein CWC27 homolog n=1 Tax=Corethrella appendiculata TaxID=1370023 RepID=U5EY38_9DIPT